MINWLIDNGVPFAVIATKTDKLSKTALGQALTALDEEYFKGTGITIIPFSSVTRAGKDEVWRLILDSVE